MNNESSTTWQDYLAIEELLCRYAFTLDNRDTQGFSELWAPGRLSREALERGIAFHRKYEYTVHAVLNHSYKITGTTAKGWQYSLVTYVKNTNGRLSAYDTYARYGEDELVKEGERWFFFKRHWTAIFSTEEKTVIRDVPPGFWEGMK